MNKIYPSKIGLFKSYIVVAILLLVIIFLTFSSRFAWVYSSEEDVSSYVIQDVVVLIVCLALDIVFWFILVIRNFYEVLNDGIVHHTLARETTYNFGRVLYINEEYTNKHKVLLFYNEQGKEIFLILDKDFELLNLFQKKCYNLISKEEYKIRFPSSKV